MNEVLGRPFTYKEQQLIQLSSSGRTGVIESFREVGNLG